MDKIVPKFGDFLKKKKSVALCMYFFFNLSLSPGKLIRGLIRKAPLKLKIMFLVLPSGGELNSRYKRI